MSDTPKTANVADPDVVSKEEMDLVQAILDTIDEEGRIEGQPLSAMLALRALARTMAVLIQDAPPEIQTQASMSFLLYFKKCLGQRHNIKHRSES